MLQLSQVTKRYGERVLYSNGNMQINPGDRIGLVGPNGAGKTTVFRLLTKEDTPDDGTVTVPSNVVVGYFSQDVGEMKGRSALEEVKLGAGSLAVLGEEIAQIEKRLAECADHPLSDDEMEKLMNRYGEVQGDFQHRGGYDLEARAQEILTGLGIPPTEQTRPVESFSGGWKMRIALAKILVLNPDALLMDEPTNHLDIESIIWLETWLKEYKGALVMTSHDREFMNRCVNKIVEISNKAITTYGGNYEFYMKERDIRREQLLAAAKRQQDMLAKEEEFIARFAARASHAAQVQSRVKKIDKIERIEIPAETKLVKFEFGAIPRSGNDVVKFTDLRKEWTTALGTQHTVFSGVSGTVQRLNKIAVTGVNGAGKSTLLKVITGHTDPTSGESSLGASVRLGYFSQHALDTLNAENTVLQELQYKLPDLGNGNIRSLLGAFLFTGDDVEKKIRLLSGGEKSRVALAIILASKANFLVLDEPTNHLDIESRQVLLDALKDFDGTVMLVSHDRYFLKAIVNRVFEINHGEMHVYEGDYDYYTSARG
jgi:ATP-binding cassette subfamily F protein 3